MKSELSLLFSLGFCTICQGIFLTSATTQVTPDGITNTSVDVNRNDFTINQGDSLLAFLPVFALQPRLNAHRKMTAGSQGTPTAILSRMS